MRVPRLCHDSGMARTRISLGRLSDDRMPEICEALEIAVDCDG